MKDETKRVIQKRGFLNKDKGQLAMYGVDFSYRMNAHRSEFSPWIESTVTLSDCSRQINLDFGHYAGDITSEKKRAKALEAIDDRISKAATLSMLFFEIERALSQVKAKIKSTPLPKPKPKKKESK